MDYRPYGPYTPPRKKKKYPKNPYMFTEQDYEEFDRISFENLIHFHQTELRKLMNGSHSHDVLTSTERKLLLKQEILTRLHAQRRNDHVTVSPKAIEILKTL